MAQLGADVEQLDLLSRKFDEEAQKIEATISADWFSGARHLVAGARCRAVP